jgi:hypothetical protein
VARLAGSQLATTLTRANPTAVPRKLNGSVALRPATRKAARGWVAGFLLHLLHAAERPQRCKASVIGRHATSDVFVDLMLEVRPHFAIELVVDALVPEYGPEAETGHVDPAE